LEGTCYGLRIVLGIQDRPNAPINASDVALLRDIDLSAWPAPATPTPLTTLT
jgi:hypothetical protein